MSDSESDSDTHSTSSTTSKKDSSKETPKDTKNVFIEKAKEFIKVDNLIKEKNELLKQKKIIEKFLLEYLEKNKIGTITVDGNTFNRIEKEKKTSMSKKEIPTVLMDMMKKDGVVKTDGFVKSGTEANKIISCIVDAMENRPLEKVVLLERKDNNIKTAKK
jgi:hypothetical protein